MANEVRKRFRPSLGAYRALEARVMELEELLRVQVEGTSRLVADCDGWRDRYRSLKDAYDRLESSSRGVRRSLIARFFGRG